MPRIGGGQVGGTGGGGGTIPTTITQPLTLASTAAGGYDTTDSTSRLTVQSYQTNGANFFGEGFRLDLMRPIAKNMLAWRLPRDAAKTDPATLRSVTWVGAHYYAQDQVDLNNPTDVHGHWSIEVPDATDALRTRLEIKFVDAAGNIGVDRTLVQTANADLVVDASNGAQLRVRTGAGADKWLEFGNDQWGTLPRWKVGSPGSAETGSNAGSNFAIQRFNDAGASSGTPFSISRANGRITMGGADGSQTGIDVYRNSAGVTVGIITTATGGTAVSHTAQDLATSRTFESKGAALPGVAFVQYADGKHEWGDGTNARDTNVYRKGANILGTDDAVFLGNQGTAPATPAAGGHLYVSAGALIYKGSNGTTTTIGPA